MFTLAGLALIGWWALPLVALPAGGGDELSERRDDAARRGVGDRLQRRAAARACARRAALWRLSTAYVAANRFRTGLTLTMFALVVLSLTRLGGHADRDASSVRRPRRGDRRLGHPRHEHLAAARPARSDLAASGVVSPDAFSAIGAASPLSVEGHRRLGTGAASRWAPVNVLAVDDGLRGRCAHADRRRRCGWESARPARHGHRRWRAARSRGAESAAGSSTARAATSSRSCCGCAIRAAARSPPCASRSSAWPMRADRSATASWSTPRRSRPGRRRRTAATTCRCRRAPTRATWRPG